MSPFDFINNINSKTRKFTDEDINKYYVPWLTNIFFARFVDSVFYSNILNKHHFLKPTIQYNFYVKGLTKRKRWEKWVKRKENLTLIQINKIKELLQCNEDEAIILLSSLSKDETEILLNTSEDTC